METLNAKVADNMKEVEAEEEKNNALDALIDLVPFDLNVSEYNCSGLRTKLSEQLERGEVGVNPLDELARLYDEAYALKNCNRRMADRLLAERAFS